MEKLFQLKENKTTVRREIVAGITTFVSMAYIFFLNPQILGQTGIPTQAYFTYTIVFGFGFTWQQALAIVFLVGVVDIVITLTHGRRAIVKGIPAELKAAIGGGIGLFVTYIGLKNAGFINFIVDPGNIITLNGKPFTGTVHGAVNSILAGGGVTPELTKFNTASPLLALIGFIILVVLVLRRVPGAFLISLIVTTLIGIPMGVTNTHIGAGTSVGHAFGELGQVFGQSLGAH